MIYAGINKLFTLIIYYKLLKAPSYEHSVTITLRFVNENVGTGGDSNRSKSSYGPVLHFYTSMAYSTYCFVLYRVIILMYRKR
jgi:hypothetical protein